MFQLMSSYNITYTIMTCKSIEQISNLTGLQQVMSLPVMQMMSIPTQPNSSHQLPNLLPSTHKVHEPQNYIYYFRQTRALYSIPKQGVVILNEQVQNRELELFRAPHSQRTLVDTAFFARNTVGTPYFSNMSSTILPHRIHKVLSIYKHTNKAQRFLSSP